MRFSIKSLLVATALVAVSICGLLYANVIWAAAFFTGAFCLVLFGVLAAFVHRGSSRPYWIGFALFALGYFYVSMFGETPTFRIGNNFYWNEPRLLTSKILILLDDAILQSPVGTMRMNAVRGAYANGRRVVYSPGSETRTLTIGHSIFTLLFALLGGWTGSWIYRREIRSDVLETLLSS